VAVILAGVVETSDPMSRVSIPKPGTQNIGLTKGLARYRCLSSLIKILTQKIRCGGGFDGLRNAVNG